MNKIALFMAFIIVIAGFSIGCGEDVKALAIGDIKTDPLSFTGEITITGVNAGFYQADPKIFFVVDTTELLACKNLSCGAYQLPAIYTGTNPMPKMGDEVNITGSWGEYDTGEEKVPIFEVTKIDVKRNIMNLLS